MSYRNSFDFSRLGPLSWAFFAFISFLGGLNYLRIIFLFSLAAIKDLSLFLHLDPIAQFALSLIYFFQGGK